MNVLGNAPIWVWPLLALLVFVGLRASRDRVVPAGMVYALPLLGGLGVRSVAAQDGTSDVWLTFGVAWLVSAALGWLFGRRWVIERTGNQVNLRGEWLTLTAVMVLFWSNFAAGVMNAVAPEMLMGSGAAVFAVVLALASGQFAGRAWAVFRA